MKQINAIPSNAILSNNGQIAIVQVYKLLAELVHTKHIMTHYCSKKNATLHILSSSIFIFKFVF